MRHHREQHPASRSQAAPGPRCVTHFHLASSPMSQTHPASLPQTTSPRTPNNDQPDQQTRRGNLSRLLEQWSLLLRIPRCVSDRLIIDDIPAICLCCQAMPQRTCRTMNGQRCRIPAGVFKASQSFDSQSRPKECHIAKTLARFATDSTITGKYHIDRGGDLLRRSQ